MNALMHWRDMTFSEQQRTLNNMANYGGHFASSIAQAWFYADSTNRSRLAEAFPDLIERFHFTLWGREEA